MCLVVGRRKTLVRTETGHGHRPAAGTHLGSPRESALQTPAFHRLPIAPGRAAGPMELKDVLMTLHHMLVFGSPKLQIIRERA